MNAGWCSQHSFPSLTAIIRCPICLCLGTTVTPRNFAFLLRPAAKHLGRLSSFLWRSAARAASRPSASSQDPLGDFWVGKNRNAGNGGEPSP
ncbi:hypothetical protein SKAU_G00146830 [Synaphobranchus kaupii]|uniref:Uncharacterized protein n=1 Tax=Synaphobranchus kaupii TaxID=118154 RepID=A0A9Q1J2N6_SYNKA|nr:hypothetical protein SKAU_G00146830 [Synaphobranchus kaupii]